MGDRVVVRHVDEVSVVEMCEGENRWNSELVEALHEALDEVEATNGPQALVTTSTHAKAFSNGADLEWLAERNPDELSQFIRTASELQARMIGFPMPTIAAVNGHAIGMGMVWAQTIRPKKRKKCARVAGVRKVAWAHQSRTTSRTTNLL